MRITAVFIDMRSVCPLSLREIPPVIISSPLSLFILPPSTEYKQVLYPFPKIMNTWIRTFTIFQKTNNINNNQRYYYVKLSLEWNSLRDLIIFLQTQVLTQCQIHSCHVMMFVKQVNDWINTHFSLVFWKNCSVLLKEIVEYEFVSLEHCAAFEYFPSFIVSLLITRFQQKYNLENRQLTTLFLCQGRNFFKSERVLFYIFDVKISSSISGNAWYVI